MKPVCLVIGAGAGIGGTVAKRFAQGGYHVVLSRRSDQKGLDEMVHDIQAEGGSAVGNLINAVEPGAIENLVEETEKKAGPIAVLVFNLGAQIGTRSLASTSLKQFELGWRMACFGLFRAAQAAMPAMVQRGKGCFLVTSSTAAVRGNEGQHSHAAAMGGRRMLCQSLNAEFGRKGIHVAHIIVDGPVDAPDTLGKMLGTENFAELRKTVGARDGLLDPVQVAELWAHLVVCHIGTPPTGFVAE
ncbi:Hsd17b4 [Symbiodinium pilosum]|uniref:Hsd17b4 protein n=1 Tax=Symbiodinium pilosum TaxID=2952 RepID=A0A812XS47_SYMPI|nr:Hsd17b4 [Symbiodinium pilosum]